MKCQSLIVVSKSFVYARQFYGIHFILAAVLLHMISRGTGMSKNLAGASGQFCQNRGVGGGRGARPKVFGRSVNPISTTMGGKLCPPITTKIRI